MKSKVDSIKQKKKLEGDINQLEVSLDQLNRNYAELQKYNKKLHSTISELQSQVEDEQAQKLEIKEMAAAAERRANACMADLDSARHSLEQAERARKACENDLHDAADRISEMSATNVNLVSQKRKLEVDITVLRNEADEAISELKNSEERVKRAGMDAARIIEELRKEQEHAMNVDKLRKHLESQVVDLQLRLDQADANALKGGKRVIQKLEQRVNL